RATTLQNHADAAHAFVGADWVATVGPATSGTTRFDRPLPVGMTAAAPTSLDGFHGSYLNGPDGLAIDPSTFGDAAWWRADFADDALGSLLELLRTPAVGVDLPQTDGLGVAVDAPAAANGFELQATYIDTDDRVSSTDPVTIASGRHTYPLSTPGA